MKRSVVTGLAVLGLTISGSCADSDHHREQTVTVYAAASLATPFTDLAGRFEERHPDVEVVLAFGGSADLAAQIVEGAPADVFAAADEPTMRTVETSSAVRGTPTVFATNSLQIATTRGNLADIESLDDLSRPDAKVVLCAPQVPCGATSQRLLEAAGVEVEPVSEEQSVTDVLGKVASGEADAGLVYLTDVRAAGRDVDGIEVPTGPNVVNRYPIAVLRDAQDVGPAEQFVEFVLGASGRSVLTAAGFGTP